MALLKDRIQEDLHRALKLGDKDGLHILRLLSAQIHAHEIDRRGKNMPEMSDNDAIEVLQREAKKRREAIELFRRGGRPDLAAQEEKELAGIMAYLPRQMSEEEVRKIVLRLHAAGRTTFNELMREAMKELKGKADGTLVALVVKESLHA